MVLVRQWADRQIEAMLEIKYGPVAEWLGRALQKLPQRFESARDLQNTDLEGDFRVF
jgi:hypothetical protein